MGSNTPATGTRSRVASAGPGSGPGDAAPHTADRSGACKCSSSAQNSGGREDAVEPFAKDTAIAFDELGVDRDRQFSRKQFRTWVRAEIVEDAEQSFDLVSRLDQQSSIGTNPGFKLGVTRPNAVHGRRKGGEFPLFADVAEKVRLRFEEDSPRKEIASVRAGIAFGPVDGVAVALHLFGALSQPADSAAVARFSSGRFSPRMSLGKKASACNQARRNFG